MDVAPIVIFTPESLSPVLHALKAFLPKVYTESESSLLSLQEVYFWGGIYGGT